MMELGYIDVVCAFVVGIGVGMMICGMWGLMLANKHEKRQRTYKEIAETDAGKHAVEVMGKLFE